LTDDWAAVAKAISERLDEKRVTQMEIAAQARISLTTLRELQHNIKPRRRRPQTLATLSEALGWPGGYLAKVLHGEDARPAPAEAGDPVLGWLSSLERELHALRDRVDRVESLRDRVEQIEQRLAAEDA
jgi:hypothetical protein